MKTALNNKSLIAAWYGITVTGNDFQMIDISPQVSQVLGGLVGLPIWHPTRAGSMQTFQLGERQNELSAKGSIRTIGAYSLHIQCSWRIVGSAGIVATYRDQFSPASNVDQDKFPDDFDWSDSFLDRLTERINELFETANNLLVINKVCVDDVGGFSLKLSEGYRLDVFPDSSRPSSEHWRLFSSHRHKHWVLTGRHFEQPLSELD